MRCAAPPQEPPKLLAPGDILATMQRIVNEKRAVRDEICRLSPSEASFANVILPLLEVENRTSGEFTVIVLLNFASPNVESRTAAKAALKLASEASAANLAREDLFSLIDTVKHSGEALDLESRRYVDQLWGKYKSCGHGLLDTQQMQCHLQAQTAVINLRQQYIHNITENEGGCSLSWEDLDGIPDILGYATHAAFKLETRMVKSAEWVDTFLSNLSDEILPLGRKEMDPLIAKKKVHMRGSPYADEYPDIIPPWDFSYYSRLAEEADCAHMERISEYFPLCSAVTGLLDTLTLCLGFRFDELNAEQMARSAWHEDVLGWAVWDTRAGADRDGIEFIGYLYMDLLSRKHKYKGSQNVNIQSSYLKENGDRVFPATAIMCSFPRPAPDEVTLLTHDNVISLFHECGHAMHDLMSRTKYSEFHGWNSPPDFNEIPSMLFENWCWLEETIRHVSRHYTTLDPKYLQKWLQRHPGCPPPPEKLADSDIQRLIGSRRQSTIQWYLSQLFFSRFDLAVHSCSSEEECKELELAKLYYTLQQKFYMQPIPNPDDWGHPEANFRHLLKGHDAGLYSYPSAHVSATKIFTKLFAEDPFSDKAWDIYRRELLQWGSSRDGEELLQNILGCPGHHVEGLAAWMTN
ncbi:hypothetical protein NQ176_g5497 [Zarea fungicola]|uniref:Uncharacterized protein n=1 Tax=Zarea fungicola TaxID=93591 RepID=A0ACC1N8S9_9HYPO|nr:hypothetical protein NQ176_g5497 [Lecanicillium fungicola]